MKQTVKLAILLVSVAAIIAVYRVMTSGTAPKTEASAASTPTVGKPVPPKSASIPISNTENLFVNSQWAFYQNKDAKGTFETLSSTTAGLPSGSNVARIHVEKVPKQIFDIGYSYGFADIPFQKGETFTLRFKARGSANNLIAAQLQRNAPPYPTSWSQFIPLTTRWQDFEFTFPSPPFPSKETQIVFKLGQTTGNIDFADLSLVRNSSPVSTPDSPGNH